MGEAGGGRGGYPKDREIESQAAGAIGGRYIIIEKLGEGTYGKVYKTTDAVTQETFALKKIRVAYDTDGEGVPSTAIREISLLKGCNHKNIIKLYDCFCQNNALYLVFEFADMDLKAFLRRSGKLDEAPLLRRACHHLCSGVNFLHGHRILHRDLKPQNVLVTLKDHVLKLADFGLARVYTVPLKSYTHEVVTLWYRAPEILLGGNKYAMPIDVWSLGCISSEMATSQALFPGDSEIDTIFKIFRTLGTPTDAVWPGISMMRDFKKTFPKWSRGHMEEAYVGSALDAHGLDFLQQCLVYNPVDRTSAKRLLQHRFFDELQPVIVHPPARYEQGIKEARPVNGSPTETGDGIAAGCRGS